MNTLSVINHITATLYHSILINSQFHLIIILSSLC